MSKDNGGVISVEAAQALVEKALALVMSTKQIPRLPPKFSNA
jgi:hypothetical protein